MSVDKQLHIENILDAASLKPVWINKKLIGKCDQIEYIPSTNSIKVVFSYKGTPHIEYVIKDIDPSSHQITINDMTVLYSIDVAMRK